MYEFMLQTKAVTALAAILLAILVCRLARAKTLTWRSVCFNYGPFIAPAFFLIGLSTSEPSSDVFAALAFELLVLFYYVKLFWLLWRNLKSITLPDTQIPLRICLIIQGLVFFPLLVSEGFGIFSEGSRIDFLFAGSLAKYLIYSTVLLAGLQAALVARQISLCGTLRWDAVLTVTLTVALSIASGSKGSSFVWLLAVAALIDFRQAKISRLGIGIAFATSFAALWISSVLVADFLGMSLVDFAELAVTRFFLTNDARALAFDYRDTVSSHADVFSESFRSISTLFGSPPRFEPLGSRLYDFLFDGILNQGANTSLAAILLFYSRPGEAYLNFIPHFVGVSIFFMGCKFALTGLRRSVSKVASCAMCLVGLQQYSQDFLAFQVVLPLLLVAAFILFWYELSRRRSPRRPDPPSVEHHHSRAAT